MLLSRWGTLAGFVLIIAVFWVLAPDTFGTWSNFRSILDQTAPLVILAVGLTVVLATGEFDLSFTGVVSLASVASIKVIAGGGGSMGTALLVGIGVGVGGSLVAGVLVASRRASSFILTLALSSAWTGLALGISSGQQITTTNNSFLNLTFNSVLGIPNSVVIALGVAIIAYVLMRWTVLGRQIQALGSNPQAARMAGIQVSVVQVAAFACLGVCVGLTAVLLSSASGEYNPTVGTGLLITPFVAAFFGTSVLAAGRFNVFGTVIGALFAGTLQTGLVVVGAQAWVSQLITGAALILILVVAAGRRA